jgi:predicted O-linked N-acetylglucosamine transferase (SPINDLY family)
MTASGWRERLVAATVDHRAGRLDDAEAIYRAVLLEMPAQPDALHLLGVLSHQRGRDAEAADLIGRAIAIEAGVADFHNNLGVSLAALRRLSEAEAAFRQALRLQPGFAAALCNLGDVLARQGRIDEALYCHHRALAAEPDNAEFHYNLGVTLKEKGDADGAAAAYERAIARRPGYGAAHNNLGVVRFEQGRYAEADACYEQALALEPNNAQAHYNRGKLRHVEGRYADEAACYRRALAIDPLYAAAHDNLLMAMNYDPALSLADLAAAHRAYGQRHDRPTTAPHGHSRVPERRLRVGYVSADLGRHPVGYFVQAAWAHRDRAQFEVHVYDCGHHGGDFTAQLRATADAWHPVKFMDDDALAALIRAHGIDILVDLAGHTGGNRLTMFARKPAPVQVTWIGYFFSTGLKAMDYALMDEASVPPGAETAFTETVVRLPGGRFCYTPPDYAPAPAPAPLLRNGYPTFGSFNNIAKLAPPVVALWTRILRAVPDARLVLKWSTLALESERRRVSGMFAAAGIDPARLDLRGFSPHAAMLAEYADIDVALDPFPFSGGLTSCEALWMGVPVLTLPGERPVSRQTLALLSAAGLHDLVAASPDDYVTRARELVRNPDRLALRRREIRPRLAASPLLDHPGFARRLEEAYRAMWRRWCAAAV